VTLDERIERARAREQELLKAFLDAAGARQKLEEVRDAEKARTKTEGESK